MSEGSRSGVNWMRRNEQSMLAARARARSVLPTPGTSSIRTWPSASRATTASLMTSGLPRTTEPTFSRSRLSWAINSPTSGMDSSAVSGEFMLGPSKRVACGHLQVRRPSSIIEAQADSYARSPVRFAFLRASAGRLSSTRWHSMADPGLNVLLLASRLRANDDGSADRTAPGPPEPARDVGRGALHLGRTHSGR